MNANRFLVVVHDVAPVFAAELSAIVRELRPMLGHRFSAAVVPRWHGGESGASDRNYLELLGDFGERLLHGFTHQREERNGLLSLLTENADEFAGLDSAAVSARLGSAQSEFVKLTGQQAGGFLPPAWQLPVRSSQLDSVRFVVRFHSIESCSNPRHVQPLTTWSWDWGRIGWLAPGGELLARFLQWKDPSSIPCVAIHPVDVRRGRLENALRIIRQLLQQEQMPVLGSELVPGDEAGS